MAAAFFKANLRWLLAGALLTFGSSYGQTFFISVFAGEIMAEFDLSDGEWGGIYSIGTTASALAMFWAGSLADHFRARLLGVTAFALLAIACLLMANLSAVWALPIVIFALRFSGQGMLTHIAAIGISRWFIATRGKALAFASFGFEIGQALLPLIFVGLLTLVDWRSLWVLAAGISLLAIPLLLVLLNKERTPQSFMESEETLGMLGRHWTRRQAVGHKLFWLVLPFLIAPGAFNTALFFQQVHLTQTKGWSHVEFVALLPLFTVVSICATMVTGWAIDRWDTARIYPWYQLPMALAFLVFSYGDTLTMAAIGFFLLGLMNGANAVITATFWAEFYGTKYLGSVKALAVSMMVLGSALGPAITGYLIDQGIVFEDQMIGITIYVVVASVVVWMAMKVYAPR